MFIFSILKMMVQSSSKWWYKRPQFDGMLSSKWWYNRPQNGGICSSSRLFFNELQPPTDKQL